MNSTAPSSPPDLMARAREIFAAANALALHDPATRPCRAGATVRAQAAQWLTDAAADADNATDAAEALQLAQAIDLIHRIVHSLAAPAELTNPLILNAFRRLTHGDQSITPYDLFPHIDAALRRRDPAFLGAPLLWHSTQVATWLRNFRIPSRPNKSLNKADLQRQAQLLLQTDLTPHLPNPLPLLTHLPSYL